MSAARLVGISRTRDRAWIERQALPNVPDAFGSSFLERNPVNVALLHGA